MENMLRVADILKSRYETVIFATTTPVSTLNKYNSNDDIRRYNEIIVPLLSERGIVINDLYSLIASDVDKYVSDDLIHLNDAGIEICAAQTAKIVDREAKKLSSVDLLNATPVENRDSGAPVIYIKE